MKLRLQEIEFGVVLKDIQKTNIVLIYKNLISFEYCKIRRKEIKNSTDLGTIAIEDQQIMDKG